MFQFSTAFFFLVAIAAPTLAGIRPSFYLNYSVWKATHIVLATEGDVIDGRLRIIESWKGNLEPGADIILPQLADFSDTQLRRVHDWGRDQHIPEPYARVVSGSRMVLFLVESEPDDQIASLKPKFRAWLPASYSEHGGFKVAVAWLERGEVYAFMQVVNPGPSILVHRGTAIEMQARVMAANVIQAALDKAVVDQDPVLAAQCFRAFCTQKFAYGAKGSMESLGRMGEVAMPVVRALLGDRTLTHWHPDIISSMSAAGGRDIAPYLTAIVQEQLTFWQGRQPDLEKGWWNSAPDNERRALRNQYGRLLAALRALGPLRYAPCRAAVVAVRDLWQSDETLSDIGDNQIARACDAVLESLPSESPVP